MNLFDQKLQNQQEQIRLENEQKPQSEQVARLMHQIQVNRAIQQLALMQTEKLQQTQLSQKNKIQFAQIASPESFTAKNKGVTGIQIKNYSNASPATMPNTSLVLSQSAIEKRELQNKIRKFIGKGMSTVYQGGMGALDTAAASILPGPLGSMTLGAEAGSQAMTYALEQGASNEQALLYALSSGIAEQYLSSKLSLGNLKEMQADAVVHDLREAAKNTAKTMGVDVTDALVGEAADLVNQALILQDKSELSRAWDENYVMADQLGLSEQAAKDFANRETTKQVMNKLQEAGINGFVSGAIHSGQVNAYGIRNAKRIEENSLADKKEADYGKNSIELNDSATKNEQAAFSLQQTFSESTHDLSIPNKSLAEQLTNLNSKANIDKTEERRIQLEKNKMQGEKFEKEQFQIFCKNYGNAETQVTIKTTSGTRTRVDAIGLDSDGNVVIAEFKSSKNAPFTKNQNKALVDGGELSRFGGVVVGKGKEIFAGGYIIPPGTTILVIRKE